MNSKEIALWGIELRSHSQKEPNGYWNDVARAESKWASQPRSSNDVKERFTRIWNHRPNCPWQANRWLPCLLRSTCLLPSVCGVSLLRGCRIYQRSPESIDLHLYSRELYRMERPWSGIEVWNLLWDRPLHVWCARQCHHIVLRWYHVREYHGPNENLQRMSYMFAGWPRRTRASWLSCVLWLLSACIFPLSMRT